MKKFLTANWQNLIMVNYEVEPNLLAEFVPRGAALDFYEEKCFVSLVAFNFVDTKVLGVSIPFHIDFEEVNLRFYVKSEIEEETRRGVVFVKEIVPRPAIALIARAFYGEPYETWKMSHAHAENELSYFWSKGDCQNSLTVESGSSLGIPAENSHAEFITEHYWGYTKRGANRTDEYKVEHPKWELFDVTYAEIDVDFGFTYGERFDFLTATKPLSILLAKGSEIVVYKGERI
ncbi:MAG: DUF2071 domain-containing protein [Pyrinomonadaceae bacterium]|jgi:uncharacterized protein YqjF (DUF2071 family)|nr:DUF2071 domain-containing protein [Acidobacteriota bacterium]MDQ3373583.1 DUF2071 domain-containing protein [Acidobacteriota bacterium]